MDLSRRVVELVIEIALGGIRARDLLGGARVAGACAVVVRATGGFALAARVLGWWILGPIAVLVYSSLLGGFEARCERNAWLHCSNARARVVAVVCMLLPQRLRQGEPQARSLAHRAGHEACR